MNRTWKKLLTLAAPASAALLMFAAVASAHVSVLPKESTTGAWETYTMKVPVEKDVNTNKVVLKMPKGVEFQQYEPIPGWKTTVDEAAGTVTWEAQGDGIAAGQFQRFTFVAKNPEQPGEAAWDAFQYYADGSIVEWTGDENADTPHSITTIGAEASGTAANSHGQTSASTSNASSDPAAAQTEEDQAAETESGVSDPASAATEENEQADPAASADATQDTTVSEPATAAADAPSDSEPASGQSVLLYVTLALSIVAIGLSAFALASRKRK
ncbi:nuclear export factor gle1 [Saccharibacillus sp. O23]|nr:nuclear export factor gle1 [Saccharibacillus sp. O23]